MLQLCVQTHAGAFAHSHRHTHRKGPSLKQQQHPRRLVFFMSGEAELMFNSFMLEGKLVERSAAQLLSVKAARFK